MDSNINTKLNNFQIKAKLLNEGIKIINKYTSQKDEFKKCLDSCNISKVDDVFAKNLKLDSFKGKGEEAFNDEIDKITNIYNDLRNEIESLKTGCGSNNDSNKLINNTITNSKNLLYKVLSNNLNNNSDNTMTYMISSKPKKSTRKIIKSKKGSGLNSISGEGKKRIRKIKIIKEKNNIVQPNQSENLFINNDSIDNIFEQSVSGEGKKKKSKPKKAMSATKKSGMKKKMIMGKGEENLLLTSDEIKRKKEKKPVKKNKTPMKKKSGKGLGVNDENIIQFNDKLDDNVIAEEAIGLTGEGGKKEYSTKSMIIKVGRGLENELIGKEKKKKKATIKKKVVMKKKIKGKGENDDNIVENDEAKHNSSSPQMKIVIGKGVDSDNILSNKLNSEGLKKKPKKKKTTKKEITIKMGKGNDDGVKKAKKAVNKKKTPTKKQTTKKTKKPSSMIKLLL